MSENTVNVRYIVDYVASAVDFYTAHLGFTVQSDAAPAFASVIRGPLRLLLSGSTSSAGGPCRTAASLVPAVGTASS